MKAWLKTSPHWGRSSLPASGSTAAAAAKSLQSCPTLCDPRDGSPLGSSVHGIFQARVLEWNAIAFSVDFAKVHIYSKCYQILEEKVIGNLKVVRTGR